VTVVAVDELDLAELSPPVWIALLQPTTHAAPAIKTQNLSFMDKNGCGFIAAQAAES
jgi:hypothetical protein